jgi:N-methylhydantoinase A/oxoprolinase/acetone carboxylase beta subunit
MKPQPHEPQPRKIRIGIDVGGTFTDVVAVDATTREIVAGVKTPTTHDAEEGVAQGIVNGLKQLLEAGRVRPEEIAFIAHSTTQATNALLEGDVARVGIIGLHGRFDPIGRRHVRVPPIALGPQATFAPACVHARLGDDASFDAALAALKASGVESVAVSEAFAVDDPRAERRATERVRANGLFATAGHEVSQMYGLRARTRTAALNAAILPTMVRTAESTSRAVESAGIGVPLMIMRSDGGVMDVREVARRPILTMLSGPAAGVAGALLHENVSDGIFIEVGGTSADCSVVRRGLPQMRPARVGGHRTMLRTLDVRTLAIAGGSLVRLDAGARGTAALRDVGPRSAHIAGLAYAAFTPLDAFEGAKLVALRPRPGDPDDYVAIELRDGSRCAPTPTCAANLLGYVPPTAFAAGNRESALAAFSLAGARAGCSAEALARAVLERATAKLRAAVDELVDDYGLERGTLELVGGGGGAASLVPFAGEALGLRHRLARDAEVISPLGVALALVRDVVERTLVNPTPEDVVRVRREAIERVVAAGAAPELVETVVDIDVRRNLVRATASGATAAAAPGAARGVASPAERREAAARALHVGPGAVATFADTGELTVVTAAARRGRSDACAVDVRGVVRTTVRDAALVRTTAAGSPRALERLLEEASTFGDVGRALPEVTLVYAGRVADLGTLAEPAHVLALAGEELRGLPDETLVVALAARRSA